MDPADLGLDAPFSPKTEVAGASGGVRDAMFLTGHSGKATLPGMSVEFPLTSLVVVLIPGTGVFYTISIGGGRRHGLFAAVRWAGVANLVNAGPDGHLP
jgi:hypothetical protein